MRDSVARRRTATIFITALALVAGAAQAQYSYPPGAYDPYGYPYQYPGTYLYQYPYVDPYANHYANPYANLYSSPYGYPPGYGSTALPTYEQLQQQADAYMESLNQQLAVLQQQADAELAAAMKPFVDYYRQRTGDHQTPDPQAGQAGMKLWCDDHPVECQRAIEEGNRNSSAWLQQSAAAHQQRMAQQQAGFDAYMQGVAGVAAAQDAAFDSWMAGQQSSYEAHQGFVQGVIYEEGNYTNGAGQTMSLPFAPGTNYSYQSPAGNPLWFDATNNVWYEVDPAGNYTPYYGQ